MALRLTLQIAGERQFDRALSRFDNNVSDLRPAFSGVIGVLHEHATRQFASEGASGANGAWRELTPRYAREKARHYPGRPILERTSAMKQSLVGVTSDTVLVIEPDFFGFGTQKPYAKYHQTGTRRMARRRIIDLTERDKRDITRVMHRKLTELSRSDGWKVTPNAGV